MEDADLEISNYVGLEEEVTDSDIQFVVGERFHSYEELKAKISTCEKSSNVQLVYNDSQTLEAARKRAPKRIEIANRDLMYYSLHLTCLFVVKKFKSKGSGQRPHHRC